MRFPDAPESNGATSSTVSTTNPFPLRVRIVQLLFLAAAVVATLFLARWQWDVWQSSGGSFQNLGYAVQWPLFGLFFILSYRKYIQYEKERRLGNAEAAVTSRQKESMTEIPADFLQDITVAADTCSDISHSVAAQERKAAKRRSRGAE